ncbi:MAG: DinB family protein [Candidatus Heimdallarchaeota archaeon]|nr:DinB family protein [Candidatus Heimdallarchaeota archaeon]
MYRLIDLYNATEKERNRFFLLFKELDEDVWHTKLEEKLWSSENIFRHLLASLLWLHKIVPDVEIEDSPLGIQYGQEPEGKYSIEEVEKEFSRVSSQIKIGIKQLSEEQEDEEIESMFGMTPRSHLIAGLMMHEQNHFGQVTYNIKRATGYSDQELREKLFAAMKKEGS